MIPSRLPRRALYALWAWTLATATPAHGQDADSVVATRALTSRTALTALALRLEQRPADAATSALLARVRARLAEGDFEAGDRVLVEVRDEPSLTDTFTVGPDRELQLPPPTVGRLSLVGVLGAELPDTVAAYVGRFVQAPQVHARALVRLSIQGEVERAGFYEVPADAVLSQALMAAGGTTREADLKKLRLERDGEEVENRLALQRALASSRTVDEAGLRDGDQILVPRLRRGGFQDSLRFLWIVVSLAGGIYGLSRAF